MWLPKDVVTAVEEVAWFRYVNAIDCERWNKNRRDGELRQLTGWAWIRKDGSGQRQGFKTITVAIRDCYYEVVKHQDVPAFNRRIKLRRVA